MINYTDLLVVARDVTNGRPGIPVVYLQCPGCNVSGQLDEEQLYGKVSTACTTKGCNFHETVNFYSHLKVKF